MMFYTIARTSPDVSHSGIKGQHWGRRRFQNEDGSWTNEGQKRYSTDTDGEYGEPGGERDVQNKKESNARQFRKARKQYKQQARQTYESQQNEPVNSPNAGKLMKVGMKALNGYIYWQSFKDWW